MRRVCVSVCLCVCECWALLPTETSGAWRMLHARLSPDPSFPLLSPLLPSTLSQVRTIRSWTWGHTGDCSGRGWAGRSCSSGTRRCMCPPCRCGCCCISIRRRCLSSSASLSPPLRLSLFSSTLSHLLSLLLFLCLDHLLLTGPVSPAQEVSVEVLLKNSGLSPELLLQALLPLTSDSGPLTLQEGQDFPPRGRFEVVGLG